MSYTSLLPLLEKTGSILTPEKFQERINIVFNDSLRNHEKLYLIHEDDL